MLAYFRNYIYICIVEIDALNHSKIKLGHILMKIKAQ